MEEKELTEFEWEMRELQQLMDPENYVPCISSAELMDQEFTPAEFVVKGFLPKGLCVLGGAPKIGKFPDTKLVVIDTMQIAKGTSKDPQYSGDYTDTGAFKTIADKHKVAMVLITHLRKTADSDTFNEITGSTGITGAADTLMTLKKSARMADAAKLSCTGRDIAQREMELRFDKTNFVWSKISDSADLDTPSLPPEMLAFVEFMKMLGSYEGGNTALAEAFAQHSGIVLTPKVLKQKMNRWCCVLADAGITFHSYDTNHGKMVSVVYTASTSHTSQISQNLGA